MKFKKSINKSFEFMMCIRAKLGLDIKLFDLLTFENDR